jgi:hypothetical protein
MNMSKKLSILLFLVVLLTACHRPEKGAAGLTAGPGAWIDAPLDGSVHPLGVVRIVTHGSDPGAVAQSELVIDGEVYAEKDFDSPFIMEEYFWEALEPGVHTLSYRVYNGEAWSEHQVIRIRIGDEPEEQVEEPEPVVEPTEEQPGEADQACTYQVDWINQGSPEVYTAHPGDELSVIWSLKNAGSCPWGENITLIRVDQEGTLDGVSREIALPDVVPPGELVELTFTLSAPGQPGARVHTEWLLTDGENTFGIGESFSEPIWFDLEVQARAGDTVPPTFTSYGYAPTSPTSEQKVKITVEAKDNVGVSEIHIYYQQEGDPNYQFFKCFDRDSCIASAGPWEPGRLLINAYAYDVSGNEGELGQQAVVIREVEPEDPPPPTPGPDTTPPNIESFSYNPNPPTDEDSLVISASASDNDRVKTIIITVTPQRFGDPPREKTCTNQTSCQFNAGSFYGGDQVVINVIARDPAGNTGSIWPVTVEIEGVIE